MSADQPDVLDPSQVEDLRGIDGGAMLARLVNMYLTKTPDRIKLLREHVAARNFTEVSREAHTLKGASGSIGAARVADTCAQIEQARKAKDEKRLVELVEALEAEYARACHALKAMVATGTAAAGE